MENLGVWNNLFPVASGSQNFFQKNCLCSQCAQSVCLTETDSKLPDRWHHDLALYRMVFSPTLPPTIQLHFRMHSLSSSTRLQLVSHLISLMMIRKWKKESEVSQSCLTLCNLIHYSLLGFSVHGIFQARVLEWVAVSFSGGSSQPRDQTWVSHIVGRRFYHLSHQGSLNYLTLNFYISLEMF